MPIRRQAFYGIHLDVCYPLKLFFTAALAISLACRSSRRLRVSCHLYSSPPRGTSAAAESTEMFIPRLIAQGVQRSRAGAQDD